MLLFACWAGLSLAGGGASLVLFGPQGRAFSPVRTALGIVALAALFACNLSWIAAYSEIRPHTLLGLPRLEHFSAQVAGSLALGTLAFYLTGQGRSGAFSGAAVGAFMAVLGFFSRIWLEISLAWRMAGWFAGTFLFYSLPLLSAFCLWLAVLSWVHENSRSGRSWILAVFLGIPWAGSQGALWHLRRFWGYGPLSLEAAAALAPAKAESVEILELYPLQKAPYRRRLKEAIQYGVNISPENLGKMEQYLERENFKGLFAEQALRILRLGWLFWWDAEEGLSTAMLSSPRRIPPDYSEALDLIRAGPVSRERLDRLKALDEAARSFPGLGFEDVGRSQLIYEGFSAAYGRFGEGDTARDWLFKVDNLWPIYEKKIEISPVENFFEGAVVGELRLNGRAGADAQVGLFYVALSSSGVFQRTILSQSQFPDASGRFVFTHLGPGRYCLSLMGERGSLDGRIYNNPGFFDISEDFPTARLGTIFIGKNGKRLSQGVQKASQRRQ